MRRFRWAVLSLTLLMMGAFSPSFGQGPPSRVDSLERKWVVGENQTEQNVLFGDITAIAHHSEHGLHVLDTGLQKVFRYNTSRGSRSASWTVTEGEGPGEFHSPLDLATDESGDVFIAGRKLRRIAQFSRDGTFKQQFRVPGAPTRVAATRGNVFATTFWMSSRTVLHVFNRTGTKHQGIVKRPDDWKITAMTGNFERIAATRRGTLLYSVPYPYRLLEVDSEGTVVHKGAGHPEFKRSPEKLDGVLKLRTGARGIGILDDTGQVVHMIIDDARGRVYLDFFSRDLQFQQRLNITDNFPSTPLPIFETGSKNTLYFVYKNPYPTVAAYTLRR